VRSFYFEAGKWVTSGERTAENIEDARQFISSHIDGYFTEFRLIQKEFYGAK
jgi:TATA-box binding protein (TBP) (component of TFIID and TFIIIB)